VKRFLDVVRLRDGASHTEVKLTAKGPRIVEGHNRRGGDRITEMVNFVYGIDLELATVAWPLGLMEPILDRPAARGGAAVRFFEAAQGTLLRVEGAEEARAMGEVAEFHVNFKPGNYLDTVRHSLDRPGYVTVFAEDVRKAVAVAEDSARTIRFVTDGKVRELGNRLGELSSQLDLTSQIR